jgi:hypothetical protein
MKLFTTSDASTALENKGIKESTINLNNYPILLEIQPMDLVYAYRVSIGLNSLIKTITFLCRRTQ